MPGPTHALPQVSIVIPTRDRPRLLERALRSVAAQEGVEPGAVEVIVVDDAGAAEAEPVVANAVGAASDGPVGSVQVIRLPVNAGRSGARNAAISAARAAATCFLDDDDLLHPTHLHVLLEAAGVDAGLLCYADAERVVETLDGVELERSVHDAGTGFRPDLLQLRNLFPIQAALVPTEALRAVGGFATDLEVLEDWDLWLRLLPHVSFRHVPVVTSEFRHRVGNDNSVTRERAQHILAIEEVYRRHPLPAVEDDSTAALRRLRQQVVRDARQGLETAWVFDRSLLARVEPAATVQAVWDMLGRIATEQDAIGGRWELVLAAPRTEAVMAALAQVEGDVHVSWYPPDAPDAVDAAALGRRAVGRTVTLHPSVA